MKINERLGAQIVETTPLNIFLVGNDGRIVYANRHALDSLGYTIERLQDTPIHHIIYKEGGLLSWEEIGARIGPEGVYEGMATIFRADGNTMLCHIRVSSITDPADRSSYRVVVLRDISEDIRGAEELERKNIEMAKMNSELVRSNTQLKKVSEMKSNFLSIASHELKTPLTSIRGYSDIIIDTMKDSLDSEAYRMITCINRAADRLHKVVNNILDVTRIEQKRLRLKPEFMDLPALIKDCIEELSQFSSPRGILFSCDFSKDVAMFYGDKIRMQQVFTNLFSNALKFSPDNSTVEVKIFLEEENRYHIVVKDHGIGIDPEERKKIFHPFYEVGNVNRHSTDVSKFLGGGTGLGLSIVKGIVERHGGRIWVESDGVKEGLYSGSEFHILLTMQPAISWDDDETKSMPLFVESEGLAVEEQAVKIDQKPLVLLIDSDKEAVEIARMVLENVFEVIVAEDGESGLTLAFSSNPSLILMDSYLPGLDGYRICRILRSQSETKDIPVAFFSAGTQSDEIQKGFACGADDFIVKPFSGKELVEKIWRLLMKKKEERTYR